MWDMWGFGQFHTLDPKPYLRGTTYGGVWGLYGDYIGVVSWCCADAPWSQDESGFLLRNLN